MEYDNDDTWRRSSLPKQRQRTCHPIPKKSTTTAVVVLGLAVLSCLLGYCVLSETLPYESKTLRLVVILFRHGAKAPESTYNSDPFKKYQWPEGPGGLTNITTEYLHHLHDGSETAKPYIYLLIGKIQLYELGKKFRDYYTNFIPEDYFTKDAYFRSSDKDRCLMSAYTFLAGLYPPSERQIWNQEINWQPIPVRSLPRELDSIVAATKPCKAWKKMYNDILAETDKDPKFTEIFDYLSKHTNESMRSVLKVDYLYSALLSQQTAGLKLPEWTKNVFPSDMRLPFMTSLALLSYNSQMQRLHTGPLLGDIRNHLEDNVQHTNVDRSLYVYSGHDVTVVSLFRALGFQELLEPEFGSSITIELHEEEVVKDSFYVKVFYRNNTKVEVPMELKLPFCEEPCEYTKFRQHIDSLIPTDWEEECQNKVQ